MSTTTQTIETLPLAKRHKVQLNDMAASSKQYLTAGNLVSSELITANQVINSIAIFSNEYLPEQLLNQDCIKYVLTINGIDYDIVPINSNKDGVKIIRKAQKYESVSYVTYINEPIKSAILTIALSSTTSDLSPHLSNIKILFGG